MLYKSGSLLIEASSPEEAEKRLGTKDFEIYRKPSKKAFMMWCWLRCGKKDSALFKHMLGQPADYLDEYFEDPNIVLRELRKAGIKLSEWAMIGEKEYNVERHSEWFYKKENLA